MTTAALAHILARARQDDTLTTKLVNDLIRDWIAERETRSAKHAMVTLRRMVTSITAQEQTR